MIDIVMDTVWSLFFVLLGLVAIGAVLGGAGMLVRAAWLEMRGRKLRRDDDDEFDITTSSLVDLARRSEEARHVERYQALRRHSYVNRSDPNNPCIEFGVGYLQQNPQDLDEELDKLVTRSFEVAVSRSMPDRMEY